MGDNRNIKRNDPTVQKLSFDEIENMKKNEEIEGAKMIEMMAASNATFENKTVFAQEKYLKKKQQKHLLYFQILIPTPRTVSEAYFCKGLPSFPFPLQSPFFFFFFQFLDFYFQFKGNFHFFCFYLFFFLYFFSIFCF